MKAYLQNLLKLCHVKFDRNHGLMGKDGHYGHLEAGAHWERMLEQEILDVGAVRIPEYSSKYTFPSYGYLALVVYVDDFLLSGDGNFHDIFWSELSKRIIIEDIDNLGRF